MSAEPKSSGNGRLVFDARKLAGALRPLTTQSFRDMKRMGSVRLSLRDGVFYVAGAWFGTEVRAKGVWPGTVEVQASAFLPLFRDLPEIGELILFLENGAIAIGGRSVVIDQGEASTSASSAGASGGSAGAGTPAAVQVRQADLEKACILIKKHCSPTAQLPARVYFSGDRLEIEVSGMGARMPATGSWPGVATVASSFVLGIARFPPRVDPVDIHIKEGRLHIATSSAICTWEPTPAPGDLVPICQKIRWSGALTLAQNTKLQKALHPILMARPTGKVVLSVEIQDKAGFTPDELDAIRSALQDVGLDSDLS